MILLSLPFNSPGLLKGPLPLKSREGVLSISGFMSLDHDSPALSQMLFGAIFKCKTAPSAASQSSL